MRNEFAEQYIHDYSAILFPFPDDHSIISPLLEDYQITN